MIFGCGELQEQPVFLWYFWRWGGWGSLLLKEIGTQKLPLLLTLWLFSSAVLHPWMWGVPGEVEVTPSWHVVALSLCPVSQLCAVPVFRVSARTGSPAWLFGGVGLALKDMDNMWPAWVCAGWSALLLTSSDSTGQVWSAGAGHGALGQQEFPQLFNNWDFKLLMFKISLLFPIPVRQNPNSAC